MLWSLNKVLGAKLGGILLTERLQNWDSGGRNSRPHESAVCSVYCVCTDVLRRNV